MRCPDQPSQVDLYRSVDTDAEKQQVMLQAFLATIDHYFGSLSRLFRPVVDPRNPKQITYPLIDVSVSAWGTSSDYPSVTRESGIRI